MKKGQLTILIIIGLVLAVSVALFLLKSNELKTTNEDRSVDTLNIQANQIEEYAEDCLYDVAIDAVYNRIGLQGGYIDPENNEIYGDYDEVKFDTFGPIKIPYWHEDHDISPSLGDIETKLARFIAVDALKCFEFDDWISLQGTDLIYPSIDYQGNRFDFSKEPTEVIVTINERDISITYRYPIVLKAGDNQKTVEQFFTEIPIALKQDFESAKLILEKAKATDRYYLEDDCRTYQRNGYSNVYTFNNRIIIYDYEPFFNPSLKRTFVFQFAYDDLTMFGFCG